MRTPTKQPAVKHSQTVFTVKQLQAESKAYWGTAGVSENAVSLGLLPAFLDRDTGIIYLSCHANGELASVHVLDGLPEELVQERDATGRVLAVKASLCAGFWYAGCYYTREDAIALMQQTAL